jgi:D-beta-D-heptose 7-phosphate kinase/D-beta-D-heptose 1-phosphate adenosyltransferase
MPLLTTHIKNFKNQRVLVIGDIMMDRFIYGKVERISPEAPVPVFKYSHEKDMPGGAGNVVANLQALGCHVDFTGIVGRDEVGRKLARLLQNLGVLGHLLKLKDYQTIVKTRLIAGSNHLVRVDFEETLPVVTQLLPRYKRILTHAVSKADMVILSDYNKGLLTPVTAQMIIELCHSMHKPVIVDPKGTDYSKYAGATLVKPNLKEFSEATGEKYNPKEENFVAKVIAGSQKLFDTYHIENLLITLSEHGMIFVPSECPENVVQLPTEAKEVFDVSGAGDTTLATMGAALVSGASVKEAMKLANIAAGIVVGKLGTATVSAEELELAISQREVSNDGWQQKRKIITLAQAQTIVQNLREKGKKIVFTNGCFDCCHLGHLHSFMQAKKLGDVLIVALNSDASIKRYKGPSRPIQDEKTRAILLASLEFIDYIIVFEEDTPLHIVETLKPEVVAKEGYTLDRWAEGRLALSYGGQAVTLQRLEGYSTSNLVEKMKG